MTNVCFRHISGHGASVAWIGRALLLQPRERLAIPVQRLCAESGMPLQLAGFSAPHIHRSSGPAIDHLAGVRVHGDGRLGRKGTPLVNPNPVSCLAVAELLRLHQ